MPTLLMIAAGGAVGAVLRHLCGVAAAPFNPPAFPLHTMAINILGSFLMGLCVALFAGPASGLSPEVRAFLTVGVLGGFTTFSAFSLETLMLLERGQMGLAALYVAASVVFSILAVISGVWLGRLM